MKFTAHEFARSTMLIACVVGMVVMGCGKANANRNDSESQAAQTDHPLPPPVSLLAPEIRVALIGDTETGNGFGSVLALTKTEKADIVMINGDFGYGNSPTSWRDRLKSTIDIDSQFVIGSLGNHDLGSNTNTYISIFEGFRTPKNGLKAKCSGTTGVSEGHDTIAVDEVCTFGNVSIIANGIGQVLSNTYLENRLEAKLKNSAAGNWNLVGYHFTLASMNPGIKGDENTFRFFDLIRQYGAIGAQAHTHTVMASCPIISEFKKGAPIQCHPQFGSNLESRFVAPGVGMYVDSSAGGKEVRSRGRCSNGNETDCTHMVDLISNEGYTRVDGVKKPNMNGLGAMFIIFNAGGDPTKAHVYFKSVNGQEVFKFDIVR